MSILSSMREDIKKAGSSKGKFIYFKEDVKHRVRFLTEFDEGIEVPWHSKWGGAAGEGVDSPCYEFLDKRCPHCSNPEVTTRNKYIWSVWDYDANEVKLLAAFVNNCSPVPALLGFYDEYGTILDRDYIIKKIGKGTNSSFQIVPGDKVTFTNKKAKPFSTSAIQNELENAYCSNSSNVTESKSSAKSVDEELFGDDDELFDDKDKYSSMSAKELYKLCKSKNLDVEPRMKEKYYITKLKEAEKAQDEWEDDD